MYTYAYTCTYVRTNINIYIHTGIFTHIHTLSLTQKPKKE